MAKGIASGMPLSACIAKAEVMNWVPGSHASTFGGNPLCLAAALATIEVIEREAMANAAQVGGAALKRLGTWVEKHEVVGEVRGRGLMIGVEIVENKRTKAVGHALRERIVDVAFEKGLLLLGCGENTIRLCPPLVVSQDEMDVGAGSAGKVHRGGEPVMTMEKTAIHTEVRELLERLGVPAEAYSEGEMEVRSPYQRRGHRARSAHRRSQCRANHCSGAESIFAMANCARAAAWRTGAAAGRRAARGDRIAGTARDHRERKDAQ